MDERTNGVPACPAGVPVFRMELAAGDRYELRQLDDFGSLPEGEYVLHAVPMTDGVAAWASKPDSEALVQAVAGHIDGWRSATFGWQGDADPIKDADNRQRAIQAHAAECLRRIRATLGVPEVDRG